jgi:hypothetical protein
MEGQRVLLEQIRAGQRNRIVRRNAANDHASIAAIEKAPQRPPELHLKQKISIAKFRRDSLTTGQR